MDSTIIFFANVSFERIETAAMLFGFCNGVVSRDADSFYFRRYSHNEQVTELTDQETKVIRSMLGCSTESAFQVVSHHGSSARFALEIVGQLMMHFPASVLLISNDPQQGVNRRSGVA